MPWSAYISTRDWCRKLPLAAVKRAENFSEVSPLGIALAANQFDIPLSARNPDDLPIS